MLLFIAAFGRQESALCRLLLLDSSQRNEEEEEEEALFRQRVSSVETSPLPPTSTLPFVLRSTVSGLGVSLMDALTLRRSAASNLYFSLNVAHVGPGRGIRTCDLIIGLSVSVAAFRSACSCLMLRRLPLHIQLELLERAASWMINQSRSFSSSVTR